MDNIGSTLFYVVVMVAVLVGAYVLTRWFSKSHGTLCGAGISCTDRMALAKDKSLYLTEVGGKPAARHHQPEHHHIGRN